MLDHLRGGLRALRNPKSAGTETREDICHMNQVRPDFIGFIFAARATGT